VEVLHTERSHCQLYDGFHRADADMQLSSKRPIKKLAFEDKVVWITGASQVRNGTHCPLVSCQQCLHIALNTAALQDVLSATPSLLGLPLEMQYLQPCAVAMRKILLPELNAFMRKHGPCIKGWNPSSSGYGPVFLEIGEGGGHT